MIRITEEILARTNVKIYFKAVHVTEVRERREGKCAD